MAFFGLSHTNRANATAPSAANDKGLWEFAGADYSVDVHNGAVLMRGVDDHPHRSLADVATNDLQLATPGDFELLEKCNWLASQVFRGVAGPVLYNTPNGFGNISEEIEYEIVAASGTTLTLRGRHPYAYEFEVVSLNPDWIPGSNARLLFDTELGCIPVGAEFRFNAPSVLEDKLRPIVKSIDAPINYDNVNDVEFTVDLTSAVDNAMQHYDEAFQNDVEKWTGSFFFYRQEAPLPAPDYFDTQFCGFEEVTRTYEAGDVDTLGKVRLIGAVGQSSLRVLIPAHFPDVAEHYFGRIRYRTEAGGAWTTVENYANRITTVRDSPTAWKSEASIGDLFTVQGAVEVEVKFMAQTGSAVSDVSDIASMRAPCSCIESRPVAEWGNVGIDTGSGRHQCHRASDASGYLDGKYQGRGCWLPDECDLFNPVKTGDEHATEATPAKFEMGDAVDLWDRITVGHGLSLLQKAFPPYPPGLIHLFFAISRENRQQDSLQAIAGTWFGVLPGGKFLSRDPFVTDWVGQRVTWTDDDGDHHVLAPGAWYKRDVNDDGLYDAASPGSAPAGLYPANVSMSLSAGSGWTYPTAIAEVDSYVMPFMGGVDEYRHAFSSSSMYHRLVRVIGAKRWAIQAAVNATDDDVTAAVGELAV